MDILFNQSESHNKWVYLYDICQNLEASVQGVPTLLHQKKRETTLKSSYFANNPNVYSFCLMKV